jgi:uncharacterized protein YjiS (DUF1127 family)
MSMIHGAAELGHTTDSQWRVFRSLRSCWIAFQQWRQRGRSEHELYKLSDRALMDIGMTRGEIEYAAANGPGDRRGLRGGLMH